MFFFLQNIYHIFELFRHEDLRGMLDGNKDSAKLDAMKRIVGVRCESVF